jgi:hypothetical protein
VVSGACTAPWFRAVEAVIFCFSAALAAFLVVALPSVIAPRWRSFVALAAFAAGLMVAINFAVYTGAIAEFVSAVVTGLATLLGIVRFERRRTRQLSLTGSHS